MNAPRLAVAAVFLGIAAIVPVVGGLGPLAGLASAGFVVHCLAAGGGRRAALLAWPILMFAGLLPLLQWVGGRVVDWTLPLRSAAVFFWVASAARFLPWTELLRGIRPRGSLFRAVLFLFILRHFVLVLGAEARRAMTARRMAVPREYGPGWFSSLRGAVTGIFRRAMIRAERFYAAQALREAAE